MTVCGDLQRICRQSPQDVQRQATAQQHKPEHPLLPAPRRLDEVHAQRQQERQQSLRIEHKCSSRILGDIGRQNIVQPQPDEPFDELMHGKQQRHRGKHERAPVLHLRQRGHADRAHNRAAGEVRRG